MFFLKFLFGCAHLFLGTQKLARCIRGSNAFFNQLMGETSGSNCQTAFVRATKSGFATMTGRGSALRAAANSLLS